MEGGEKAGGATTATVACVVCGDRQLVDGCLGEQSEAEERRKQEQRVKGKSRAHGGTAGKLIETVRV